MIMNKNKAWKRRKIKKINKIIKVFWLVQVKGRSLKEVAIRHQVRLQLHQQMVGNKSRNKHKGNWLRIKNKLQMKQRINKILMKLPLQNQRNLSNLNHQKRKKKIKLKMIKFQRNQVSHLNQRHLKNQKKTKKQLRSKQKMKKLKKHQ